MHDTILILDFGSQYNQLISRRVREQHVYAELIPHDTPWEDIMAKNPKGIILSGGPSSVYADDASRCAKEVFTSAIPVLGICYGHQLMAYELGGVVERGKKGEYGKATFTVTEENNPLVKDLPTRSQVWMSHFDTVGKVPDGFETFGTTETCTIGAMAGKVASESFNKFSIQFHPEVLHTTHGKTVIKNFLFDICHCNPTWTAEHFIEETIASIKTQVGPDRVICAVSGGVDSSVVAALIGKAIGDQLTPVFVDTGLLRKNEAREVEQAFANIGVHLNAVDAKDRFLSKLAGVSDPEKKRKIIGHEFIAVFETEKAKLQDVQYLAQGTLYPDVIESKTAQSKAGDKIKTHHNVGGLPENMQLDLIEPLRWLFKDEVREVGRQLGLPTTMVERHPFPGPGLAVRIIGEITEEKIRITQEADAILLEEMRNNKLWLSDKEQDGEAPALYNQVFQALAVLTSMQSVGVMGDERTYNHVLALRIVVSEDAMTCDWAKIPYPVLETISSRIVNEVKGVNRVVYDITTKPPATIEWE